MKIFKKPIFVSISPNAEFDDVFLAVKMIGQPWNWKKGSAPLEFQGKLEKYLDVKEVFLFESGRTSLYAILLALNLKEGDEVLIQGFTCTAAVNPILWARAKPIYVNIDKDFNMSPEDLKKKITPKSRVLIIQHTFGYPAKIKELVKIAKENNLLIIEDAAHALGAEYEGKKIGTFGDAAMLSFGRQKIISSVFGGAAVTDNPKIVDGIKKFYEQCDFPSGIWILRQLMHPLIFSIAKPLYNFFGAGKIIIAVARALNFFSLVVFPAEKEGGKPPFPSARMPNALAVLGLRQFNKLEKFNAHRKELSKIYEKGLRENIRVGLIKILPNALPVFMNFPIQLENPAVARDLIAKGRRDGIYLEVWPAKKVIGPAGVNFIKLCYPAGASPDGEDLALRSVVLPTNPNTTKKDAERVVKIINEFFKKPDNV